MPGPSLFIRQQVPLATEVNDGLMSAGLVVGLDNVIVAAGVAMTEAATALTAANAAAAAAASALTHATSGVFYSNANAMKNLGVAAGVQQGGYTTGLMFYAAMPFTLLGIRWHQQPGAAGNVKLTLWDVDSNVALVSATVASPVSQAVNEVYFPTPYSVANVHRLAVTGFNGIDQICYVGAFTNGPNQAGTNANQSTGVWGPNLWLVGGGEQAGDNGNLNPANGGYNGIEPIYTVP